MWGNDGLKAPTSQFLIWDQTIQMYFDFGEISPISALFGLAV